MKFTAESDTETVFLDTVVYKGTRFNEKSILDVKTFYKKQKPSGTYISPLVESYKHYKLLRNYFFSGKTIAMFHVFRKQTKHNDGF